MAKKKSTKPKKEKLNPKWELFCRLYTLTDEFFGNATLAYAEAFDYHLETLDKKPKYAELPDDETDEDSEKHREIVEASEYTKAYNTCSVQGNRLLRNNKILERCSELLNDWMTENHVDAELAKVVRQNGELAPKVMAIREFNKLKGRITDKVKVTNTFSLSDILDEVERDKK